MSLTRRATGQRPQSVRFREGEALRWLLPAYLAAFVILPFLASGVFPSQDGPAHLHTASLLASLRDGTAKTVALFVEEADFSLTNTAAYWLLSRLLEILPPARAEWAMALLASLLLAGMALVAPRLLGGRRGDAALGVLLAAPLMLYMGSFALVLAMTPGFLALVFAARLVRTGAWRDTAAFGVLALGACALQIQVAVPILGVTLGGIAGTVGWRWLRGGGLTVPRAFLLLGMATLPVLAAAVAYQLSMSAGQSAPLGRWAPVLQAGTLVLRGDLVWFSIADPIALGIVTAILALAALRWLVLSPRAAQPARPDDDAASRQLQWLLFGAVAMGVALMVLPRETASVPQITQRLAPFAHWMMFLWFILAPLPAGWRRAVLGSAVATGLLLTASRSLGHAAIERGPYAELAWAEAQIPDGSVVAFVRLPSILEARSPALQHGGMPTRSDMTVHLGRGIVGRDVMALSNYQVMPIWDFFRVRLRPQIAGQMPDITEMSVMVKIGRLGEGLEGFQRRLRQATGREVEWIILWTGGLDTAEAIARNPHIGVFLRDLEAGFTRGSRSSPTGLAELWRRAAPP